MRDATLGRVFEEARRQQGYSQEVAAKELRVDRTLLSRRENDAVGVPAAEIEQLAKAFRVSVTCTPDGWVLGEAPLGRFRTFGRVPCGYGIDVSPATWDEAETIDLGELTGGRYDPDRHFLMQADGQSMEGAGIQDGDWLVAEWKVHARPNDIVVATLNDTTTVKRLVVDAATDVWMLAPASERYSPRELTEYDEVMIQGVVIGRLRFTELR